MAETHNRSVPDRFENGLHARIISEHRYAPEGERGGNLVGSGDGEHLWFLGTLATIKVPARRLMDASR
jgi:hypothetical protein